MPRIPNAATSEVMARTSGTTEATIAPNANSRIRNVSGIVSRSESSRPVEIRRVDVVVDERAADGVDGEVRVRARASASIGRTGAIRGVTRVSSPSIRPTMRTVEPSGDDEPGLGRGVERVGQLAERRRLDAVSGAPAAFSFATRSPTRGLERGIGRRAGRAADHDDHLLEGSSSRLR